MPDMPVATPAAPAAPAAPVTPVAAPVSTPTPAPVSTPAPASTPAVETPSASPAAPATETATPSEASTPAAAAETKTLAGKPAPKREDYGRDIEKFLKDTYAWEEDNPGLDPAAPTEPAEATSEEIEEAKPEGEETEADKAENPQKEIEVPTPEALSRLLEGKPELKAAIEADPEVKGAIYTMARQNAKAAPILEIFPNVEAAKFANEHAGQFVGLKTSFQLADTPEKMAEAAVGFFDQFKVVDEQGKPVLDAAGKPTYGEDLQLFTNLLTQQSYATRVDDLKARIEANAYLNPASRENDEQLLAAYEFIRVAEAGGEQPQDRPDLAGLSPEARAYIERREQELDAEREKLGLKDKALTQKSRTEMRQKYESAYQEKFGGTAGKYIATYLEQKEKDGVNIPHYLLTMTDPKTNIPVFALTAFNKLNEKLASLPQVKMHAANLQMQAITDAGLDARLKYSQEMIDTYLPGIIDGMLREANVSLMADGQKKIQDRNAGRKDARIEPASGSPSAPRAMTDEQMMAKAKVNVADRFKGQYIDPRKRMEEELKEKFRIESGA